MIHLFLLPSDNDIDAVNYEITLQSMGSLVHRVDVIKDRNIAISSKCCETDWWGYLFTDEYIPEEVQEALPSFFASNYEVIVLMRRHTDEVISKSPRFFRKEIKIKQGTMLPENSKVNSILCLNGFIETLVYKND